MHPYRRRSAWFYVGLIALTLAWGPPFLGFVGVITWGVIFIPVVGFLYFVAPYVALNYALWKRPILTVLGAVMIASVAVWHWPDSKPESGWKLVSIGYSGRMDLRFVMPGDPESRDPRAIARNR